MATQTENSTNKSKSNQRTFKARLKRYKGHIIFGLYLIGVLIALPLTILLVDDSSSDTSTSSNQQDTTNQNRADDNTESRQQVHEIDLHNPVEPFNNHAESILVNKRHSLYLVRSGESEALPIVSYPAESSEDAERIRIASIDPTESTVLFTHSTNAPENTRKFSYYRTSLSMYDIATGETVNIIESPDDSVTHIEWSPDGTKYSYVLNESDRAVIRDVSGTILFEVADGSVQPIQWIDNDTFSFIRGNTLIRSTIGVQEQETIAENASTAIPQFEGPGQVVVPHWSGQYVAYKSTSGHLVVLDTNNDSSTELGTFVQDGWCLSDCPKTDNAEPIGWLPEGRFVYKKYLQSPVSKTRIFTFQTDGNSTIQIAELEGFTRISLSTIENHLVHRESDGFTFIEIIGDATARKCTFVQTRETTDTHSFGGAWASSSNGSSYTVVTSRTSDDRDIPATLERIDIVDTPTCEQAASVVVP